MPSQFSKTIYQSSVGNSGAIPSKFLLSLASLFLSVVSFINLNIWSIDGNVRHICSLIKDYLYFQNDEDREYASLYSLYNSKKGKNKNMAVDFQQYRQHLNEKVVEVKAGPV